MNLHDLRRMEELEARSRTCGHVVPEGGEALKEGCVSVPGCEVAVRLFVYVWVGDVLGFVAE
jgi:hypothetical protein